MKTMIDFLKHLETLSDGTIMFLFLVFFVLIFFLGGILSSISSIIKLYIKRKYPTKEERDET